MTNDAPDSVYERWTCAGCKNPIGPLMGCRFIRGRYYHCDNQRDCSDPGRGPIEDPNTIKIDSGLECKGRNGWFEPRSVEAYTTHMGNRTSFVRVFSKQTYGDAPVQLIGSRNDVVALLKMILDMLEGVLPSVEGKEPYRRYLDISKRRNA